MSYVFSQSRTRVKLNRVFRTPPLVSPKFPSVPPDGLWATKSEGVGIIVRAISFQHFQPMSQTERQTDGRTTCNRNTALCTIVYRVVINLPKSTDGRNT